MAFFDKVKSAAAEGLDKAKDLGEIGAAKAKIAVAEGKIKDVYTDIGRAVVEAGGVIPAGGISAMLEKIEGFKAEIAEYEADIVRAKED